jgi:hypothetical protein
MKQINEHEQDLIERYFEGALSGPERKEFDRSLDDPNFREAMEFHYNLLRVLKKERDRHPLKQLFREEEKKIAGTARQESGKKTGAKIPQGVRIRPIRRWMAVAASVIILVIPAYFIYLNSIDDPRSALAQEFLELPRRSVQAGGGAAANLEQGKDAFFNGDYSLAIKSLEGIPPNQEGYAEARILTAYAFFKKEQYPDAVATFGQLLKDEELFIQLPDRYRDQKQIRWARMLAYYAAGQTAEYQSEMDYFQSVGDMFYRNKAVEFQRRAEGGEEQ